MKNEWPEAVLRMNVKVADMLFMDKRTREVIMDFGITDKLTIFFMCVF